MQTNRFKLNNIRIFEKTYQNGNVNRWMRVELVNPNDVFDRFPKWVTDRGVIEPYLKCATLNDTEETKVYREEGTRVYDMQNFDALKQESRKLGFDENAFMFMQNVFPVTVPLDGLYSPVYKRNTTDNSGAIHKKGDQILRNGKPQVISSLMLYIRYTVGPDGTLTPAERIDEIVQRTLDNNYIRMQQSSASAPEADVAPTGSEQAGGGSVADTISAAQQALAS